MNFAYNEINTELSVEIESMFLEAEHEHLTSDIRYTHAEVFSELRSCIHNANYK